MEQEQKLYQQFQKIEFWTATGLFLLFTMSLISKAINNEFYHGNRHLFENNGLSFNWYKNHMFPSFIKGILYYSTFLILIFQIVKLPVQRSEAGKKLLVVFLIFIALALFTGICNTWIYAYKLKNTPLNEFYEEVFIQAGFYCLWLFLLFSIYIFLKHIATYLLVNTKELQKKYSVVSKEGIIGLIIFMYLLFIMIVSGLPWQLTAIVGVVIPFSIGLYWLAITRLIPRSLNRKRPVRRYLRDVILILLATVFPLALILSIIRNQGDYVAAVLCINYIFQLVVTTPVAWYIYKSRFAREKELMELKTELGTSTANLDFLKSQINPHFLFNALNTLYGTAIQEDASRTGEGIQRLGDMMRFMLEENIQDKIPLNREIEYIKNYISLQKLRTDSSSSVSIITDIDEQVNTLSITPMLLIPFIENAFKHGVSFREPSHIKVSLKLEANNLYFDVYNSIHRLKFNDPENNYKGIGLQNVKSRLEHHYPERHELIIRENLQEYFIHLTIQL